MNDLPDNIDINNFQIHWDNIGDEQKEKFIKTSELLAPGLAIQPVLKGLNSYHLNVRSQARNSLKVIQARIHSSVKDLSNQEQYQKGMKASARVCSTIFNRMEPNIPPKEQQTFFTFLLGFEGKGPYFALKAVYTKRVDVDIMEKTILSFSNSKRLEFIHEYLQTSPEVRLKYSEPFKRIIQSINKKDSVIKFFAGLFDAQQDLDPFLYHLNPKLRAPAYIILNFLSSSSPQIRMRGLKALAMIVPKVSTKLMLNILETEKDVDVRMTLYKIVENSSLGTYPDIFYPLLNLLDHHDDIEAFHTFKALLVSGKLPLIQVIDQVKKNRPNLMGHIYKEISNLSKISFFFIQDIALNAQMYFDSHIEINQAAAFGMIKKRPERVVRILKDLIEKTDVGTRQNLLRFIETTKKMLVKEAQDIEKKIIPIVKQLKTEPEPNRGGFFHSLFSSSTFNNNIEALKNNKNNTPIIFNGETLNNLDLSSIVCTKACVYLSFASIINTNLSKASFFNAFFKNCTFYKVNMQNAVFDSVCFDNACFIDVDATSAMFKKCSFQNITMYKCNFDRAIIKNAPFVTSSISKSSFDKTDLSCSSFAYCHFFAVSFANSNIEHADFSGIKARFSRFPAHSRATALKDGIDLNARKYQIELDDLPEFGNAFISRINMLIFSEFTNYGETKFFRQNKQSIITAFDIFKPKQTDFFQIIPYLLHENISLPGTQKEFDPDTPHGIYDYYPSNETLEIIRRYARNKKMTARQHKLPVIEGLFTIGSIGSIAQASDSDIDYWVCIYEKNLTKTGLKLLHKKLEKIESYALKQFNTQVTFFLVDIIKANNNNFGDSTFESSGSAQTRLLKEEFYRTMIYVAGKLPLWAVLPTSISKNYYENIFKTVCAFPGFARYIDLGDVHQISPSEFFGASIWQMFKSLKSPFKSVIKMALLEQSVHEHGKKALLCNIYKDEWMNSGVNLKLAQNDPYYILLKNLIEYYDQSGDKEATSFLLICFFLKLGISKEKDLGNTVFGLRRILIEKCMIQWGWSKKKLVEFGGYKKWPYQNIADFSKKLENHVVKKYKTINQAFETLYRDNTHDKTLISPEDRTVLGRKVYSELSKVPGKIQKVFLASKCKNHFQNLNIKYLKTGTDTGTWELFGNMPKKIIDGQKTILNPIIKAGTIEQIGAWLIHNRLYDEKCLINLTPNPTPITIDDIIKLFKSMNDSFESALETPVHFDKLLVKSQVVCLFVSINFYAPKNHPEITHYTSIALNSWGEMFYKSIRSNKGFSTKISLRQDLMQQLEIDHFPAGTSFYTK